MSNLGHFVAGAHSFNASRENQTKWYEDILDALQRYLLPLERSTKIPGTRANNDAIGTNTVITLTEVFRGSGRNFTCDNFFTNLNLAGTLVKDMKIIGTVRRNKPFLPKDFQAKKHLPLRESGFLFRKQSALVFL